MLLVLSNDRLPDNSELFYEGVGDDHFPFVSGFPDQHAQAPLKASQVGPKEVKKCRRQEGERR